MPWETSRHEGRRWELRGVPRETEVQIRERTRCKGNTGGEEGIKREQREEPREELIDEDTREGTAQKGYASPTQMVGLAQLQISK
nr:hypothetical protein [uncultured Porphyromonas sp.]